MARVVARTKLRGQTYLRIDKRSRGVRRDRAVTFRESFGRYNKDNQQQVAYAQPSNGEFFLALNSYSTTLEGNATLPAMTKFQAF